MSRRGKVARPSASHSLHLNNRCRAGCRIIACLGVLSISFIVLTADRPKNWSQWLQEFNSSPYRRTLSGFVKQKFLPACQNAFRNLLASERAGYAIAHNFLTAIIRRPVCRHAFSNQETLWQAGGLFFRIERILMFRFNFDIIFIVKKRFGRQWSVTIKICKIPLFCSL